MEFLNIVSGKITPDKGLSEISHQNYMDLEVARLKSSLEQDNILADNYMPDLHLVALLLELQSVQDLR